MKRKKKKPEGAECGRKNPWFSVGCVNYTTKAGCILDWCAFYKLPKPPREEKPCGKTRPDIYGCHHYKHRKCDHADCQFYVAEEQVQKPSEP